MRLKISIIANIVIFFMVIYGLWLMMAFTAERVAQDGTVEGGALMAAGLRNLRFFTVLSNILEGIAAAAFLGALIANKGAVPGWAAGLKLAAAASVALTFVTVMVFLGPTLGYKYMFTGSNLWFHAIIPIAAMLEYVFIESYSGFPALSLRATFLAVVPMLLYGVWYLLNILRGGMADGRYVNDWYGFAFWGIKASLLVFIIIAAVTWLLAVLLRFGNMRLR